MKRRRTARTSASRGALLDRAFRVRLLLLDVDGVLTDGRLYYGPDGEELKVFDVRDGHGVVMLRDHVDVGILSGRSIGPMRARLEDLRFKHAIFGQREKLPPYQELVQRLGLTDAEVAYMGDDVNDVPVLERVGLAACPADAHPAARAAAHLVSTFAGGRGAVRELCELILRAKGLWQY